MLPPKRIKSLNDDVKTSVDGVRYPLTLQVTEGAISCPAPSCIKHNVRGSSLACSMPQDSEES